MNRLSLQMAISLTLLAVLPAQGVILSGGLRTTLYVQKTRLASLDPAVTEYQAPADRLETSGLLLQTVRLDVAQLGVAGLSFHTSVTGSARLKHQPLKHTLFRFYRGYLQSAGKVSLLRYDARLGRQWVSPGVGSGVIDGLSLNLSSPDWGAVDGFCGTLGSDRMARTDRFWDLDKPSESLSLGGRVRVRHPLGTVVPSLAVSYAQNQRTHRGLSRDSLGTTIRHEERVTDSERLGLHGEVQTPWPASLSGGLLQGLRLYGDYRKDMILGRTLLAAGGAELSGRPRAARLRYEFERRRPSLAFSSFFASFDSRPIQQHRLGAGARVYKDIRLDLDGDLFLFDGHQKENGLSLLASGYGASIGYRFHNGYGGGLSGIVLYGHRDLTDRIFLDASIDFTRYKYGQVADYPNTGQDDSATAEMLAASYRLLPLLLLTGQIEGMENAGFQHDVRVLGMVQWDFRRSF